MRLRINKSFKFEENGTDLFALHPSGFRVKISKEYMSLIRAFDPPVNLSEVRMATDVPQHILQSHIGQLQDFALLIPDDDMPPPGPLPLDLLIEQDSTFREILRKVRGYTMGTPELCYALFQAVNHIHAQGIEGAIVESGVWRGGNIALCALTLLAQQDTSRELYMFDTFDWSWPDLSAFDTKYGEGTAEERNAALKKRRDAPREKLDADLVSEERVDQYLISTGYPSQNFIKVKGLVQDTVPASAPEKIALLRLDTDLYESTYHELVHLYPRLVSGGILIIDDYPTEHGCVKAVEEYFSGMEPRPFFSRIHTQGRIAIKPGNPVD